MSRKVPEWIGKDENSPIPPRVRLRIFEHHNGHCYLSGRKIGVGEQWDCDHIVALINGGEHRESNLAPVLKEPHKAKTIEDVKEKSIVAKKRKTHLGIRKKSRFPGSRDSKWKKKLNGTIVER